MENREIDKYRVWDEETKEYVSSRVFINHHGEACLIKNGCFYPHKTTKEHCTGVPDKNGNLIYAGDVVRVEDDDGVCNRKERIDTGIGTVEWVDCMWFISGNIRHGLFEIDCTRNIEIIGNVHETEVSK